MNLALPDTDTLLRFALGALTLGVLGWYVDNVCAQPAAPQESALRAFEVIRSVFQHPRCQNCHIPGDSPLQGDEGRVHGQYVARGPDGRGNPVMRCQLCHTENNLPATFGRHVPPGAPDWHLPGPGMKMVFIGLTPRELCLAIKDRSATKGKDLAGMMAHVRDDKLVAWGWSPGDKRTIPAATRAQTVAAFGTWMDAGAPCPM
jgi:hypothetical protein